MFGVAATSIEELLDFFDSEQVFVCNVQNDWSYGLQTRVVDSPLLLLWGFLLFFCSSSYLRWRTLAPTVAPFIVVVLFFSSMLTRRNNFRRGYV